MPRSQMIRIPYLHDPDDFFYMNLVPPPVPRFDAQVFSYTPEGQATLHIAIAKAWMMVFNEPDRFKRMTVGLTREQAEHITENNGVELPHLARVRQEGTIDKPGLLLHWPDDNTHTVIDGNHRYVMRVLSGRDTMEFYEIPRNAIDKCLLDLPQDFGLPEHKKGMGARPKSGRTV